MAEDNDSAAMPLTGATSRLTYRGPAALLGAVAQQIAEEGLTVAYDPAVERRGVGDVALATVEITVSGFAADAIRIAVRKAYAKLRERFPGMVEIDEHDGG